MVENQLEKRFISLPLSLFLSMRPVTLSLSLIPLSPVCLLALALAAAADAAMFFHQFIFNKA